ncbi:hypothetical protein [Sphingomonas guangdongensis]|uniref:hypothetical protein n=1 Tax=Sphingomonas guangdongensis TaxID=1141890 RepID=UPI001C537AE0|nr:hypothetical protein [Sphingomonas guangdongensis]
MRGTVASGIERAAHQRASISGDGERLACAICLAQRRTACPKRRISAQYISAGLRVRRAMGSAPFPVHTAPYGLFNGLIWPKAGCRLDRLGATATSNFLPLPAAPPFLAMQESPSLLSLPLRGAPPIASDLPIAIEAAMERVRHGSETYHGDHRHLQEDRLE